MVTEIAPTETELPGFNMLRWTDSEVYFGVSEKVQSGVLPHDTFLRLGCVGHLQTDESGNPIMRRMLTEMNNHPDDQDALSPDTRDLIFGKLPSAMLDWNGSEFESFLRRPGTVYFRKGNLVETIKARREHEDKAINEPLLDRRLRKEISICRGLAHGVWRILLREARPEWVNEANLSAYYQPAIRSSNATFNLDDMAFMRRRIVSVAVFSGPLLKDLYEKIQAGEVRIGETGTNDLRHMLAEEYPRNYPPDITPSKKTT